MENNVYVTYFKRRGYGRGSDYSRIAHARFFTRKHDSFGQGMTIYSTLIPDGNHRSVLPQTHGTS